jgi:hypothetical protein
VQLSEAITAVVDEGGFDTTSTATPDATVRGWINEMVQTALATSKFLKATVDLGPTVADQDTYELPANIVGMRVLRVGPSLPYMAIPSLEDLWAFQSGYASIWPGGFYGTFSEDSVAPLTEDTTPTITLVPTPTEAGLAIEGIAAVLPPAIEAATLGTYVLPLPEDVVRAIAVDGAIGLGLLRSENRADLAAAHTQRADDAIGVLTKRAGARVGGGPRQMRIVRPRIR